MIRSTKMYSVLSFNVISNIYLFIFLLLSITAISTAEITTWQQSGFQGKHVLDLKPSLLKSEVVYAAIGGGGCWKTVDGGTNWFGINRGLKNLSVKSLAVTTCGLNNIDVVFVGCYDGPGLIYKNVNGALNWECVLSRHLVYHKNINSIAVNTVQCPSTIVYVGEKWIIMYITPTWGISDDCGEGWDISQDNSFSTQGGEGYNCVQLAPNNCDVIYIGGYSTKFDNTGELLIPTQSKLSVLKSTDKGSTWSGRLMPNCSVTSIAVHPDTTDILYATVIGAPSTGIYKSTDGGEYWSELLGLPPSYPPTCVIIDPDAPNVIYVGTAGEGVYRSTNDGQDWEQMNNGLTNLHIFALTKSYNSNVLLAGTKDGVFRYDNFILPPVNINLIPFTYKVSPGDEFCWTQILKNNNPTTITFWKWSDVVLPNGITKALPKYDEEITLTGNEIRTTALCVRITTNLIPGDYIGYTYVGPELRGEMWDYSCFYFEVLTKDNHNNNSGGNNQSDIHIPFDNHTFGLQQPTQIINYTIDRENELQVFDLCGRLVGVVKNINVPLIYAGSSLLFSTKELQLPVGVYLCRFKDDTSSCTRKLILLK